MKRVLIANRGEIAVRLAAAARRAGCIPLGIASAADADALHRAVMADSCIIGPAPAAQSYLDGARILDAAFRMRAEAIHPGYGFLSERADFAEAVTAAGLLFIGPSAETLRDAGDKGTARKKARAVGLSVLDGYDDDDQSDAQLRAAADTIGYPVLLKASNGGGGRGQRMVAAPGDFADSLAAARREARSAFGDERMVIERFIINPRHIEFQILADKHGTITHFGERDCSLQRRRQKVMEEAPAPGLSADVRSRMGAAAIAVAAAVNYENAGTVEFLLDENDNFYFLEINARLQVEHPVTEAVYGIDLAQWQFRIARGEALPPEMRNMQPRGWAIEARLCAEDPRHELLPAAGTITEMRWPSGSDIRIDAGFSAGDRVPLDYDSLIAKLIVSAPTRDAAILRMRGALAETKIAGIATNIPFVAALLDEPAFLAGTYTTGCIEESMILPRFAAGPVVGTDREITAFCVAAQFLIGSWRTTGSPQIVLFSHAGLIYAYQVESAINDSRQFVFTSADAVAKAVASASSGLVASVPQPNIAPCAVELTAIPRLTTTGQIAAAHNQAERQVRFTLIRDNERYGVYCRTVPTPDGSASAAEIVVSIDDGPPLHIRRWDGPQTREAAREVRAAAGTGRGVVTAPMPGRILRVLAAPGDTVGDRALLAILEAMKMEHRIEAAGTGTIARVAIAEGDIVSAGTVLFEITA